MEVLVCGICTALTAWLKAAAKSLYDYSSVCFELKTPTNTL